MAEDPFISVLRKVSAPGADERVVVLVAHGFIELIINTLVEHFCRHGKAITQDTRAYPHATKLLILHEKRVLPDPFFESLNRFRKLRNDAAHEPFFKVAPGRLRDIAEPLEVGIPVGSTRPSETLDGFARFIIQSLVAQYQGILLPVFAPQLPLKS